MHFVLYTDKSVAQCIREINERMQAKPTKSKPELNGWIEKKGAFSIALTAPVFAKIKRTTRLTANLERDKGTTVIRGYVSDGLSPYWMRILFVVMIFAVAILFISNRPMFAFMTVLFSIVAYIPMRGDYVNSDRLLIEVERALKASPKPPKR